MRKKLIDAKSANPTKPLHVCSTILGSDVKSACISKYSKCMFFYLFITFLFIANINLFLLFRTVKALVLWFGGNKSDRLTQDHPQSSNSRIQLKLLLLFIAAAAHAAVDSCAATFSEEDSPATSVSFRFSQFCCRCFPPISCFCFSSSCCCC